jgi:hypothetical protein
MKRLRCLICKHPIGAYDRRKPKRTVCKAKAPKRWISPFTNLSARPIRRRTHTVPAPTLAVSSDGRDEQVTKETQENTGNPNA